MYKLLWKQIEKTDLKRQNKQKLFIGICTIFWTLIGTLVWFTVGDDVLGQSLKWMIFFIGLPSVILGFVCAIMALFKLDQ